MQSINSTKNKKNGIKTLIIASLLILVLIAGLLFYTETHNITHLFTKSTSTPKSPEQKEQATKIDPTTTSPKSSTQLVPGVNQSQTTNEVPTSTTSTISILTLNETNNSVNLTSTITNPASSGVCTITFTKNGAKPVTQTVNTTTNTCNTSIPALQFDMIGVWQVTVNYFANNAQATTTGSINIK